MFKFPKLMVLHQSERQMLELTVNLFVGGGHQGFQYNPVFGDNQKIQTEFKIL